MQNKNPILIHIGHNIRDIRKSKNISQEGLALKSDLDRSYVGRVERGERNLSVLNVCKLAKTLKVNPCVFFEGVESYFSNT